MCGLHKVLAATGKLVVSTVVLAVFVPAAAGANEGARVRAQKQIEQKLPVLRRELKGALLCLRLPANGPAVVTVRAASAEQPARLLLQHWGIAARVETQSVTSFDRAGERLAKTIAGGKPRRFTNVLIWWSPEQFAKRLCPRVNVGFVPHQTSAPALLWARGIIRRYGVDRAQLVAIDESTPV
jgi:hypothetical protein